MVRGIGLGVALAVMFLVGGLATADDVWQPVTSEDTQLLFAAVFTDFDAALAAESRDEAWATRMEDAMRQDVAERLAAGTELLYVRCGATICRFALRFSDYEAREAFYRFPSRCELYDGEVVFWNRDDERTLELAIPRQGHPLPAVGVPVERPDSAILRSFER